MNTKITIRMPEGHDDIIVPLWILLAATFLFGLLLG